MNEVDWLRRTGELPTDKEYKKLVLIATFEFIIPTLILVVGSIFAFIFLMFENIIMASVGFIMMFVGGIALIIMAEYIQDEHMGKIRLYRHYKKHPEDFEPRESADK